MRIALVGGGAAAVSLMDGLLRHVPAAEPLEVVVYEAGARPGPGRAYRTDEDCALINARTAVMSVRTHEPGHFLRWLGTTPAGLGTRHAQSGADSFLPRWVFGEYLADCLERACHGGRVRVERKRVHRLVTGEDGIAVGTSDGALAAYDRVVLCVGGGEPARTYDLEGAPRYRRDPYPLTDMAEYIRPGDRVLIAGTGLSAVDTALALRERGHDGPITMASRRGLLPAVRVSNGKSDLVALTPRRITGAMERDGALRLEALGELLLEELARVGVTAQEVAERVRPGVDARSRLLYQFREADTGGPWQRVLTTVAIRRAETLWRLLPDRERGRYLRGWHHVFQSECNPMPPMTGAALLDLIDDGQLTVRDGTEDIRVESDGSFTLLARGERHTFDTVVNTVRGTTSAVSATAGPLISGLIAQGTATPHPYGGIRVDPDTHRVVAQDSTAHPRLHALGDITAGEFYYTSSLEVVTRHADRITDALLAAVPGTAEGALA
ncbi:FAD/NAD(P)-binding protein [Streptomyces sp. NPDC048111]|uniref:FAD/NAD(P)-binding protein n=1 Tax=Streptomyces sp. NPDC048111 TaxID=3365500 RepID=UPI0037198496